MSTDPSCGREGNGRCSILIVEDDDATAEMLKVVLDETACEVRVAHTGKEALQLQSEHHPDIALVDIGLPDLSGLEIGRRMRASQTPPRQLIAVSGYSRAEDRSRAKSAGFDVYVVKPLDVDQLRDFVEQTIRALRERSRSAVAVGSDGLERL